MLEEFVAGIKADAEPPIDVHRSDQDCTLPGVRAQASAQEGGAPVAAPDLRRARGVGQGRESQD